MWQLIPAAVGLGMQYLNKPKRSDYKADTKHIEKYISQLRGRQADREVYHQAMQPALRTLGAQGGKMQRQIDYEMAKSGMSGSGIEAQYRLSAQQKTMEGMERAGEHALAQQTAESRRLGEKAEQATMQVDQAKAQASKQYDQARNQWYKSMWSGAANLAASGVAQMGMAHSANVKALDAAKLAGAPGVTADTTVSEFKDMMKTAGVSNFSAYATHLAQQGIARSGVIDKIEQLGIKLEDLNLPGEHTPDTIDKDVLFSIAQKEAKERADQASPFLQKIYTSALGNGSSDEIRQTIIGGLPSASESDMKSSMTIYSNRLKAEVAADEITQEQADARQEAMEAQQESVSKINTTVGSINSSLGGVEGSYGTELNFKEVKGILATASTQGGLTIDQKAKIMSIISTGIDKIKKNTGGVQDIFFNFVGGKSFTIGDSGKGGVTTNDDGSVTISGAGANALKAKYNEMIFYDIPTIPTGENATTSPADGNVSSQAEDIDYSGETHGDSLPTINFRKHIGHIGGENISFKRAIGDSASAPNMKSPLKRATLPGGTPAFTSAKAFRDRGKEQIAQTQRELKVQAKYAEWGQKQALALGDGKFDLDAMSKRGRSTIEARKYPPPPVPSPEPVAEENDFNLPDVMETGQPLMPGKGSIPPGVLSDKDRISMPGEPNKTVPYGSFKKAAQERGMTVNEFDKYIQDGGLKKERFEKTLEKMKELDKPEELKLRVKDAPLKIKKVAEKVLTPQGQDYSTSFKKFVIQKSMETYGNANSARKLGISNKDIKKYSKAKPISHILDVEFERLMEYLDIEM